jgi:hypothetical protein
MTAVRVRKMRTSHHRGVRRGVMGPKGMSMKGMRVSAVTTGKMQKKRVGVRREVGRGRKRRRGRMLHSHKPHLLLIPLYTSLRLCRHIPQPSRGCSSCRLWLLLMHPRCRSRDSKGLPAKVTRGWQCCMGCSQYSCIHRQDSSTHRRSKVTLCSCWGKRLLPPCLSSSSRDK